MMPTTRTSARLATRKSSSSNNKGYDASVVAVKRKTVEERSEKPDDSVRKRARKGASGIPAPTMIPTQPFPEATASTLKDDADALVPATLTFSLEKAKEHLIRVDHRFKDIFNKMPCKPYENLEQFHPFRLVLH